EESRTRLDQQPIGVSVITTVEFDDLVAAGRCPRQAHSGHRRLSARIDEAHHLDRWEGFTHQLGELDLAGRWGTEAGSFNSRPRHRLDGAWMGVAEDQGTPGCDEVEVLIAVLVPDARSGAAANEGRLAADRLVG